MHFQPQQSLIYFSILFKGGVFEILWESKIYQALLIYARCGDLESLSMSHKI